MNIASVIEHTNLSPTITAKEIDQLVVEASNFSLFGICVPPFWVKRAKREVGKGKTTLITVVGFPFGYQMTETKLDEAQRALDNGADEIDWVWNISSFKTGLPWTKIELAKASKFIHDQQKILKVIIETSYLSDQEIVEACKICNDAGADFVKTSTGFAREGATVEHVRLMRMSLPATVGIKAAGGIKTFAQSKELLDAGAERIGTSSGVSIAKEQEND
ncbi:MAG TPA: deoxyribose-phosphate aldolase [Cyclobacteriaceae bacterium]|nr:deoxyribose-phosphate aldolase [Cyclobacteriaceae bacterium]HRK52946.1 deoxyribose-phosphate aldolase [Cyclobacteriaceae bacterium]